MDTMLGEHPRVVDVAAERGMHPVELLIELSLEKDMLQFFRQPVANELEDDIIAMIKHPFSVPTFLTAPMPNRTAVEPSG